MNFFERYGIGNKYTKNSFEAGYLGIYSKFLEKKLLDNTENQKSIFVDKIHGRYFINTRHRLDNNENGIGNDWLEVSKEVYERILNLK